jgi:hypothetical protein
MLVSIDLRQFEDYKESSWVRSLISLSDLFFQETEVLGFRLFLETDADSMNVSLDKLNEASSVDFKFCRYKLDYADLKAVINLHKEMHGKGFQVGKLY